MEISLFLLQMILLVLSFLFFLVFTEIVRIWDKDGQNVATLQNHTAVVKHAVFSPNGKFIASTGRDNVVNLYNANRFLLIHLFIYLLSYKLLASFKGHLDWINYCSFSPDSKKIVSGSWDYNVKV